MEPAQAPPALPRPAGPSATLGAGTPVAASGSPLTADGWAPLAGRKVDVTEAVISVRGVSKTFGKVQAVRGLDLDVPRGSLCGFLGPNGAGKTTTIRMIMSIIYPDQGSIDVLGSSALHNKDRIGYLPEERGVYRKMRVGEFLEYIAKLK